MTQMGPHRAQDVGDGHWRCEDCGATGSASSLLVRACRADYRRCEACGTVFRSAQAASVHRHIIRFARGSGMDVALIEKGLAMFRHRYEADSDVAALERLFHVVDDLAALHEAKGDGRPA